MANEFFGYNLPLQVFPTEDGTDAMILNYMPRRESVSHLQLSELIDEKFTREKFFEEAALIFENLARLMRLAATDNKLTVYYPDEGMQRKAD